MGVSEVVERLEASVVELREASLWACSDAESRELVARLDALAGAVEAVFLSAVRDLDSRPGAVAGARPGRVAVTFLRERLRGTHAAADVAAAHLLAQDLPMLGDALAAGEVSREHVDSAVRTLRRIPGHFRESESQRARIDAWFTETAQDLPPLQADKAARYLLQVLDPDGVDRFDPQAIQRREVSVVKDSTGMVVIRGQLDLGTGEPLLTLLDHLSKPAPCQDDEDQPPIPDPRTKGQRNADALGLMVRLALGALGTGSEVDRPKVVIHAPLHSPAAETERGGPIAEPWLARFACDAVIEAALTGRNDNVLNLGRAQRTITTHQRRALIARDGGCIIPTCHAPGARCDGHHVRWWSKNGPTDLANLALLCPRHHTDVHAGIWTLEPHHGQPRGQTPEMDRPAPTTPPQHLPTTPRQSPPTTPRPRPTTAPTRLSPTTATCPPTAPATRVHAPLTPHRLGGRR